MRQSWVKTTTSEGNRRGDSSDYLAAAVLPTRELIVAHNEGVYRVNISGKCVCEYYMSEISMHESVYSCEFVYLCVHVFA